MTLEELLQLNNLLAQYTFHYIQSPDKGPEFDYVTEEIQKTCNAERKQQKGP